MATGPAPRLLVVVHLGSERALESVHRDSSFAEKRESHAVLLLVARSERAADAALRRSLLV
jgi:hypothetical protein